MASLAESGRQTPIVVVLCAEQRERYLVIDGYKRMAALEQLGRDTVEAVVWPMSAADALLLERTLRRRPQESALEQGWLLGEMEQSFGYGPEELARRFDRSVSWVSRRLALVELLPESIQHQVREGKLGAQLAMKYLVPVARVGLEDGVRMASALVQQHCNTREAGQLYAAWREGSRVVRECVLAEPELFSKTQRQVPASRPVAAGVERDREQIANRPCKTHSSTASAEPAASYKSPYRKWPGAMLFRSPRMFRAGALVDRALRFATVTPQRRLPPALIAFPEPER
jgi:ParB/RepB/Spo0J family partition protein